jgi:2-polyprenyl-3-methyl-5-hydroxy-6-metoxy-1,4-benzoquinol methylase
VENNRFDMIASTWDVAPQHLERTRDIAALMRRRLDLSGRVALEVGAGTGLLSFALADSLKTVVATDPSQGMIDVLQDKIRQSGCGNIQAVRCGDDLAGVVGPFDLAMMQMALHHVPDVDGFLHRAFGKLHPGGILAIADLDTEDGSFHGPDVTDVHHGFDRADLSSRLREAGFESVSIETAHTMVREVAGSTRSYPIFLALARRLGGAEEQST